jgi:cyanophycinase
MPAFGTFVTSTSRTGRTPSIPADVRITSKIGGAPVFERIQEIYRNGGIIAGTSAGASALSETMLVGGASEESPTAKDSLHMAPGLGFLKGVIVDQHFAERGRLGRLVGAVTQNPRVLGIGIDEDTAVEVRSGSVQVLGSGSVYVVDAMGESFTNISEEDPDAKVSVFDLRLHILSAGDGFDLGTRRPKPGRRALGKDGPEKTQQARNTNGRAAKTTTKGDAS